MTFRLVVAFLLLVSEIHGGPFLKREDGNPLDYLAKDDLNRSPLNHEDLSAFDKIWKTNEAEDLDDLFEGDIKIDVDSQNTTDQENMQDAVRDRQYIWRTKIVSLRVSKELVSSGYMVNIQAAIAEFAKYTCIKWKPRGKEKHWVRFIKSKGCWSQVGYRRKSPQLISLEMDAILKASSLTR
ncbi:hypothetical protein OS493_002687 [Desmophyllum pertusum]|uniref:Peptidase M12A domain-containing protein n=1 Tax=Desmophyllum pertusum TaxID=174260 RepID=A0A9W9YWR4_9CNID|nr:hypothetical protein OS493_002687 [Desmophyllum pertusum]